MPIPVYLDHNVPRAIAVELRRRGVDVLTAFEDGTAEDEDRRLLDRATELGRAFAGVIYAHQLRVTLGTCIRDLETIAKAGEPEDLANRVEFLPL